MNPAPAVALKRARGNPVADGREQHLSSLFRPIMHANLFSIHSFLIDAGCQPRNSTHQIAIGPTTLIGFRSMLNQILRATQQSTYVYNKRYNNK